MGFNAAFVTVVCLIASTQIEAVTEMRYNFSSSLDGLEVNRGRWEWSDRASLPWRLPDGGDGFAVHYKVGEGDELYEPFVDISNGLEYEIKYFIASEYDRSTTLQVQQLSLQGQLIEIVADYYVNSYPYNEEWFIGTGKLEASNIPSRFGVFCQTNGENTQGDYLYGCALDYMKINVYDPPTTTTTSTTTTTTTTPTTTTTTTPTTTTTTPTTTTTTPTTTTTTTTPTTTTTTTPTTTTTTTTPTTTTTTTTTTTPEPTTTEAPDYSVDSDFSNGTCGWTLGRSNGASWKRATASFGASNGNTVLQVFPEDSYSGIVLAMSPRYIVGPYGTVNISIEFYMKGTYQFPSYLSVRRSISYVEFDENPLLNLDVYGNGDDSKWIVASGSFSDLIPGQDFSIVLEGNLGIANLDNIVAVSRVFMDGVFESSYPEDTFFDLTTGLVGWQSGSMDGGNWNIVDYSTLDESTGIPQPSSDNILMVERFNIHSGVVTIESPPIRTNTTNDVAYLSYWLRASDKNPVSFRMSIKTIDGVYDRYPFFHINAGDLYNDDRFSSFSTRIQIPVGSVENYFQIVIEADLGGDADNMFVIDRLVLT